MFVNSRIWVALALVLALVCGCGGKGSSTSAKVSGQVTFKGKPVGGGTITFYPESGGQYQGTIDADGAYYATDLPPGDALVAIETDSVKAMHATPAGMEQGHKRVNSPLVSQEASPPAGEYVKLPAKYAKPKLSGLSVTLAAGRQTKNFELTD
jgi:hypothetical protein